MSDLIQGDLFVGDQDDVNELYRQVFQYRNGRKFKELLDFCTRFRKLSVFNCALLQVQRPGCRYALTANRWERDYERVIKTDARPLVIIRPFGPVEFLFDAGDTMPKPGCRDRLPEGLTRNFEFKTKVSDVQFDMTRENLAYWGISFGTMQTGLSYYGKLEVAHAQDPRVRFPKEGPDVALPVSWPASYTIKVRDDLSLTNAFGTILHEMGHLACHHLPCAYEKKWNKKLDRTGLSHEQVEFEAQTVAWLVGHRIGLDIPATYSYLAGYLGKDCEIPPVDFMTVFHATSEVEKLLYHCTIKSGWLWKYSPSLQSEYRRLNT